MKGAYRANVSVAARIRPLSVVERSDQRGSLESRETDDSITVFSGGARDAIGGEETFYFDTVLDERRHFVEEDAAQARTFEAVGRPLVEHVCRGVSTAIIAYGQTGSGKTHTILGSAAAPGLAPRLIHNVIQHMEEHRDKRFTTLTADVVAFEMLNEKMRDLLAAPEPAQRSLLRSATMSSGQIGSLKRAKSSLDSSSLQSSGAAMNDFRQHYCRSRPNGVVQVEGMTSTDIRPELLSDAVEHAFELIRTRRVASRSTAPQVTMFVQCTVKEVDKVRATARSSTMTFVDLCGSERANRIKAAGSASMVHKSLTALRTVVDALVETSSATSGKIVPYRDSTLTWLLSDALGGACRTSCIACVAPNATDETLHTLAFVQQLKSIVCNVAARDEAVACVVGELQKELTLLQKMVSADAAAGDSEPLDSLKSELTVVEDSLRSAAADREALSLQKLEFEGKLAEQEGKLQELHGVLDRKSEALQQAKSMEEEITAVVERQMTATKQIATELALHEKRSAQLVMHRQRQHSIIRRHESMIAKAENAKREAEQTKRNELATLFRNATAIGRQRAALRSKRADVTRLQQYEVQQYDRLRELQALGTEAATLCSEEQLKCDFLTEELDDIVEQWDDANRERAEAMADYREAMTNTAQLLREFKEELQRHDAALEMMEDARHAAAFDVGVRLLEGNAEADSLEREVAQLSIAAGEALKLAEALETNVEVMQLEASQLPGRQRSLRFALDKRRTLLEERDALIVECKALESEVLLMEEEDIAAAETRLKDARALLDEMRAAAAALASQQEALKHYVDSRVFHQENLARCAVLGSTPSPKGRPYAPSP